MTTGSTNVATNSISPTKNARHEHAECPTCESVKASNTDLLAALGAVARAAAAHFDRDQKKIDAMESIAKTAIDKARGEA